MRSLTSGFDVSCRSSRVVAAGVADAQAASGPGASHAVVGGRGTNDTLFVVSRSRRSALCCSNQVRDSRACTGDGRSPGSNSNSVGSHAAPAMTRKSAMTTPSEWLTVLLHVVGSGSTSYWLAGQNLQLLVLT